MAGRGGDRRRPHCDPLGLRLGAEANPERSRREYRACPAGGETPRWFQHAHGRPGTQGASPLSRTLVAFRDAFDIRLRGGTDDANASLDGILSSAPSPMVRAHDFRLANREVASEADVEALVAEIRDQLLVQIRAGSRGRFV